MVIKPVHHGSISILKVHIFWDTLYMEWRYPRPPSHIMLLKLPCQYMMSYRMYFLAEKERAGFHSGTLEPPSNPDLLTFPLSYSVLKV